MSANVAVRRPFWVALLAILMGIFAVLLMLGSILGLLGIHGYLVSLPENLFGLTGVAAGIVGFLVGAVLLGIALGLYGLRQWALILAFVFVIFELINIGLNAGILNVPFWVAVIVLIYLIIISPRFRF